MVVRRIYTASAYSVASRGRDGWDGPRRASPSCYRCMPQEPCLVAIRRNQADSCPAALVGSEDFRQAEGEAARLSRGTRFFRTAIRPRASGSVLDLELTPDRDGARSGEPAFRATPSDRPEIRRPG